MCVFNGYKTLHQNKDLSHFTFLPEYAERYGPKRVWSDYRRNHKGGIPPQKTRKTCIVGILFCGGTARDGLVLIGWKFAFVKFGRKWMHRVYGSTRSCLAACDVFLLQRGNKTCGNPCPICRDSKIVIHYKVWCYLWRFTVALATWMCVQRSWAACKKYYK